MPKKISKQSLKWIGAAGVVVLLAFVGFRYWRAQQTALPDGIASGNGRLEAKLVDIAAKEPLKVKAVLTDEGALVRPGQVLVQLDTTTLESELTAAGSRVAAEQEKLALGKAEIVKQQHEIQLADIELRRSENLVREHAGSQRELDVRRTSLETTKATLAEVEARLETIKREIKVAKDNAATIQTRIDDATLKSPVVGRVLYRLAEPGEVLAAGGKALTLVDLQEIYMEIFLPSQEAANVKIGAEGRITVDYEPKRAIAGNVTFVSPEAQFTPKQVETRSERDKLMFRVKIQVPKELSSQYVEQVKTGVRGVGYVKVDDSAQWPEWLQHLVGSKLAAY